MRRPTQLFIHGQWWSIFSTQRLRERASAHNVKAQTRAAHPQTEQWCASGGFVLRHLRHQRGRGTPGAVPSTGRPSAVSNPGSGAASPPSADANRSGGDPGSLRTHIA